MRNRLRILDERGITLTEIQAVKAFGALGFHVAAVGEYFVRREG